MGLLLQNICQSISLILGFKKTKQSILPYIELMKRLGILESTDNPLKPYNIVKSKEEIMQLTKDYLPDLSSRNYRKTDYRMIIYMVAVMTGGMPEMVFEYILKQNGIDPAKDLDN